MGVDLFDRACEKKDSILHRGAGKGRDVVGGDVSKRHGIIRLNDVPISTIASGSHSAILLLGGYWMSLRACD